MRYQEKIYIQNNNSALRNRNNVNINMSSDICVFNAPLFNVSGATKIDCTGSTTGGTYVISTATTIPLIFDFTGNTNSFLTTNATFKYEIYKYIDSISMFDKAPVYKSDKIQYSAFSGTNTTTQDIPVSGISLDGEYLIKGYYDFTICTDFVNRLGKNIDTLFYKTGNEYGLYDGNTDYYFQAIKQPDKPIFYVNGSDNLASNTLQQQIILPIKQEPTYSGNTSGLVLLPPKPYRTFTINGYSGSFVLTLNGLVLAPAQDYTFSGTVVTLNDDILPDDIITVIYTSDGTGNKLIADNIFVDSPIINGTTGNEGNNKYYYNVDFDKFEIFTSVTPNDSNSIIVMINGVTLANNVDYYQSTTNKKRIILEGDLVIGDVITIAYFPQASVVNGVNTTNPLVSFSIATPPQKTNGFFSLEVSNTTSFNTILFTGTTDYSVGVTTYGIPFTASGTVGTQLYYRVKNEKNYITFCGNSISAATYSDIIPIIIQTNYINSY
jgi:hypothetical protein